MLIAGCAIVALGISQWKRPDRWYRDSKALADTMAMYPKRIRDASMNRRAVRKTGFVSIWFGVFVLGILIWRLLNGYGFM